MPGIKKSRRSQPHDNPVKLKSPGENDILCGKDRACALHKGSQHFRAVIDQYRTTYQKAVTKYDKMQLTKEIYTLLSQESRFLKFNDKEKLWEEITPLQGRDKIGHALRFANSNAPKGSKGKKVRKGLRRQGSFSSCSATTASTSAAAKRTKAELVASVVEVVKEEPKVWDSLVDHLTSTEEPTPEEAGSRHHQRVASLVDPVALENIAYAVESNNNDDAALDDLITLLNDENIITEETLQDVLDMAAFDQEEVPPTVSISLSPDSSAGMPPPAPVGSGASHSSTNSVNAEKQQHVRGFSVDDDAWSVMKEPLMDFDDWR
ncbi:expressed unknown protein [Seminavis robusta]|uniref:DUF6824 domain-containing protein n=1 Tax=Seminavis robusta TaxID=568900 RepID=A0A9N8E698_9STRA|nr:expressed unknown protein [Seminavis robusta]|eukprot:Sro707_g190570.1 n/a (320) ;mRNA; r:16980-18279